MSGTHTTYTLKVGAHISDYQLSEPPSYLSSASANALISDIQPTTILPKTLHHVNLFLDEILYSLLAASESLNPGEIRSSGVPAVFSADKSGESTAIRSLGRSAVGEAELELRSWVESNGSLKEGFGRDGKGNGMKREGFALQQAFEVMRGRCEEFSTLAGEDGPRKSIENQRMAAWVAAGGNGEDVVLSPAALYITAILEHVCEHVLAALSRVVGRDSDNTAASLEDLFTAVAEDDGIWGFFKRMQVRVSLEDAIKARQKRAHPNRPSDRAVSRGLPNSGSQTSLIPSSSSGAIRDQDTTKKSSLPPSSYDHPRPSYDTTRSVIAGNGTSGMSKSPSMSSTARFGPGIGPSRDSHTRSASVLSANTRNMLGAYNDQSDAGSFVGRSRRDEEDDFDALVASGETMKVSLTPSRLKNFDAGRKNQSPSSSQAAARQRDRTSGGSPARQEELPPLLPRSGGASSRGPGDTPPRPPRATSFTTRAGTGTNGTSAAAVAAQPQPTRLQARGASIVAEQEDSEDLTDDADLPSKARKSSGRESLAELLASTGPARSPKMEYDDAGGEVKRTVPAVILGSPPPKFDHIPEGPSNSAPDAQDVRGTVNRPARQSVTADTMDNVSQERKRSATRDMADVFNDGPPNSAPAPAPIRRTPPSAFPSTMPGSNGTSKPKTPAQEMADFFNNAPAPPSSSSPPMRFGAPVENLAPAPAKKGFKGFIAKIGGGGGGSSKRKGSADFTSEGAGAKSGGIGQGQEARRQKSMANMSTSGPSGLGISSFDGTTKASSIADQYRTQQQRPPSVVTRTDAALPPIPTAAPASASADLPPLTPSTISAQPTMPTAQKRLSQTSISGSTTAPTNLGRKLSVRKPVPYADTGRSPDSPHSPTLANLPSPPSLARYQDSPPLSMSPSGRGAPRKPSTVDEDTGLDTLPDQPAPPVLEKETEAGSGAATVAEGVAVRSLREEKSIDQLSFATAREGQSSGDERGVDEEAVTPRVQNGVVLTGGEEVSVDSVPETREEPEKMVNGDAALDTVPEAAATRDQVKSDTTDTAHPTSDPTTKQALSSQPSIPLADLLPLRHLLNGATSVKECQMLLSAILSQWGVPPLGSEGDAGKVDPESRIAAWLLAGRDGPVGDGAKSEGHEKLASSEGTIVAGSLGKEGRVEEEEGLSVTGVIEGFKKVAVEGIKDIGKVF